MKKLTTTLLAAAMLTGITADAARTVHEYPAMMPTQTEAAAAIGNKPMRAPLNQERPLGTKLFGVTAYDFDIARHYVTLYSNQPGKLNKLNTVLFAGTSDEQTPVLHGITAGAWAGDGYYGYKTAYYSATGSTYLDCWVNVDTETGVATILKDLSNPSFTHAWTYTYDLAWNPKNGKFYGLAYGDKNNQYDAATSKIISIDKATGDNLGNVKALDDYYFCMAFDYDGNLYAIRWTYNAKGERTGCNLDIFDEDFDRTKTTPLYVDGASFLIYFQNGLEFDYSTGDLYWAAANDDTNGYLIKIDPQSGATTNLGTTGYNEMLKALYVPYVTAESRTAPARVADLAFAIDQTGANKVTINWTNPTTQWNRKALSTLKEVKIFRDGAETAVATLDATGKEGQAMSWTDDAATKGVHSYTVVAYSADGKKGVPDTLDAYVGRDTAGPVRNLVASPTADGKGITISWQAPVTGDSNGWFDAESLEYKITRLPDNKVFEGTVKETSFSDLNIPEAQAYSYVVTPVTTDGEGTPVTSNSVIAGMSILPPFAADLSNEDSAARFTCIDKNQDGNRMEYAFNTNTSGYSIRFLMSNGDNDDILATPPLSLRKGHTYRVKYHTSYGCYGKDRVINHKFRIVGGTAATAEAMTDLHSEMNVTTVGLYPTHDIDEYFVSPVDGDYFVGLEILTSNEADMWSYIESFEITECPDNDLSVESFKTYLNLSSQEKNTFYVDVYNNGQVTQTDYKVGVAHINVAGEPVIFAEIENVPALAPHKHALFMIEGAPDRAGDVEVVGVVTLANDGNLDNNLSKRTKVMVDDYTAFTYTITDGKESYDPNVPMSHYRSLSMTQTIYNPDMTGLNEPEPIEITRLAWEYNGLDTFDGTEYKVYLTETDKKLFSPGDGFVNITTDPIFEGPLMVKKGTNYVLADLDEIFYYNTNKSLLVTVVKHETAHADWLTQFLCFDDVWREEGRHSLRCWGDGDTFDVSRASSTKATHNASAPVLHLAAHGIISGVDGVSAVNPNATLSFDGNVLTAGGAELRNVKAYTMAGATAASKSVNGTSARLDLAQGIYIVRATLADGSVRTMKVVVK